MCVRLGGLEEAGKDKGDKQGRRMNVHLGLIRIVGPGEQDGRGIQNAFNQFAEVVTAGDTVGQRADDDIHAVDAREMNDNVVRFTVDKYEPWITLVRSTPISVNRQASPQERRLYSIKFRQLLVRPVTLGGLEEGDNGHDQNAFFRAAEMVNAS